MIWGPCSSLSCDKEKSSLRLSLSAFSALPRAENADKATQDGQEPVLLGKFDGRGFDGARYSVVTSLRRRAKGC
jgi:hypothetical protein